MTILKSIISNTGLGHITIPQIIMVLIALFLAYLAIVKKYEPLLLLPLAFGMMIANVPLADLSAYDQGGLIYYLYQGIELGIYPPLIFLCIGTMTDFAPLISNPKTALIGLGGQLGIFVAMFLAYFVSRLLPGIDAFSLQQSAAIGIIGSSDGPTSIYTASQLASELLPVITVAAYSYMALVPIIQPPIMKALVSKEESLVKMPEPKRVTRKQKIGFAFGITLATVIFVPEAGTLIAMLMLGNLIRESGVTDRYVRTLSNHLLNILTLLIGLSIGATATADRILSPQTLLIIVLGLIAFGFGTVGGIVIAKILCKVTGGKVNPLIGNSGVSAMPMAARVSQTEGLKADPQNHLLMHAMGPIVASTIGSAIIAGILITLLG